MTNGSHTEPVGYSCNLSMTMDERHTLNLDKMYVLPYDSGPRIISPINALARPNTTCSINANGKSVLISGRQAEMVHEHLSLRFLG